MELTEEVRAAVDASVLCWLATVAADGTPNVSPKEVFTLHGDHLLIAHIASPGSVANIERHPLVSVAMVDVFEQRGVKLTGRARVVRPGDADHPALLAPLDALVPSDFPIRAVIDVGITRVARIVAPSYALRPHLSAAERRAATLAAYGVCDREAD